MAARTIDGLEQLRSLVGQEVGDSDWLEVTQPMINAFAEATRDHQWIHSDVERAQRDSPFGTTIAHGFLSLSLISHLHSQAVNMRGSHKMGINYGLNRVRFPNPVRCGSRVRSHSVLKSIEDFPGGVQLLWLVTVELEGQEKPAVVAEWLTRLYA
ncbi:MAG TPA: MaoC family dehydratase [Pirellulales bacterium]|jgi:acyl dehydratase|nr:MaoC family dehydratase [Pirellulales bacterium]